MEGTIQPHDDALVVTARINGFIVKRVIINQGGGADVMYPDLSRGIGLKKDNLSKYDMPLMGFDGHMVIPEGQISLPMSMEGKELIITFIVVAFFFPYTTILGRPWIYAMGAVPSTLHVKIKFRTEQGIVVNINVFAWSPYEVPGVDPKFIVHNLNVDLLYPSKKQKPRRSTKEHVEAVRQEVKRLKEARAIKEIFFPEWLANIVVVKKKNGKWRVYVDFTDLNRACPKDLFLMLKIDQLVDATYKHSRMSFLDAFQGYHQIALAAKDQEKTAFITLDANYHYTVMPFGLQNAGTTYQRMMTRIFRDKIGNSRGVH
ncbi:uncharacterized protein LOC142612200 [Castanea sativa]|uniref:uncharacterized protein LOC142612200 n=1 Tax=Castanea sativa TaxID=21020 RepID=UPI003F6548CD